MNNQERAAQIATMTISQCQDELEELRTIAQRGIGDTSTEFEEWCAMLEQKIKAA
jgi:hypothetical protein